MTSRLIRVAPDTTIQRAGADRVVVTQDALRNDIGPLDEALVDILDCLPLDRAFVLQQVRQRPLRFATELDRFFSMRMVEDALISADGRDIAVAHRPDCTVRAPVQAPAMFKSGTYFVADGPYWIMANPLQRTTVSCDPASLLQAILTVQGEPIPDSSCPPLVGMLTDLAFFVTGHDGTEDWEFHDRLFHAATSAGFTLDGGYGGKRLTSGLAPPPPFLRHRQGPVGGSFARPPVTALPDLSFSDVLNSRRSRRDFQPGATSADTITTLVHHTLGAQRVVDTGNDYYALHRYASGGARDEISALIALRGGRGADSTLSAFLNHSNEFVTFDGRSQNADGVLEILNIAAGTRDAPSDAAILLAADYGRVAWKYEAISYATILRNVGCLYQTVAMTAHALGLACCPIGGGWGSLEPQLADLLLGRVIVGALLVGQPSER